MELQGDPDMLTRPLRPLALGAAFVLAACSAGGSPDPLAGFGPDPKLPPPSQALAPQIAIAKPVGWTGSEAPRAPEGFEVTRFAGALAHPRWLLVLPNGDVLVAESSSEKKGKPGFRDHVANLLMGQAGAIQRTSPNRITLLRDADGDGLAELQTTFVENIRRPFGMTLVGDSLYVAQDDGIVRLPYKAGDTKVSGPPERVFDLPAGRNHHWTKNVFASPDGKTLYATVGSNSNIGENGMAEEEGRAAIWAIDPVARTGRLFATGLRNPNGLDFEPVTGALWTTVNERDELGPDLVPDYMTSVRDGGFYGWPYSYFGQIVDERVQPQRPDLVAKALKPDYALGSHTASLGLAFYRAEAFPEKYQGGAFVGQHGSWNRKPFNGYRVVFVPFAGGKPSGPPEVFLDGFLTGDGKTRGRPVGVAVDSKGALLVADDSGKAVWRVAPKTP
jgi:glucose/arabinose dehydrogenase